MQYPLLPGLTWDGQMYRNADMGTVEALLPTGGYPTAHAPALLELPDGSLLCAWFGGTYEGSADIRIICSRLDRDSGKWTEPVDISGDPNRSEQNPSLFYGPDNAVWAIYTAQLDRQPGKDNMQYTSQIRCQKSTDSGRTWGEYETLFAREGSFCRQPIQVLSNGRWIFGNWLCSDAEDGLSGDPTAFQISDDQGKTWRQVDMPRSNGRVHANVVELDGGHLAAFMRSRAADFIYRSESFDWGEIKGIIPPILTPMNKDESINLDAFRSEIERLLAGGVHGIFPVGTNGEAYILSANEKLDLIAAAVDQVKGRVPVYAGTGCVSTAETIRMSIEAEKLGADALSIITPYFAAASQHELYAHYAEVAKHVSIPIVLYNIPPRTGNKILPETVARLGRDIDVIMGAKDSSGDLENLKAYIRLTRDIDGFAVLAGNDGNILNCLKEGGAGGIAGHANIYPRTIASIYDYFVAGDLEKAQEMQDAVSTIQRVFKFGNPNTVIKKAAAMRGFPVGDCRRPFNYLPEEGMEELKKVLDENAARGLC